MLKTKRTKQKKKKEAEKERKAETEKRAKQKKKEITDREKKAKGTKKSSKEPSGIKHDSFPWTKRTKGHFFQSELPSAVRIPKPPPIVEPTREETESSDSDNLLDDDDMTMLQSPVPTLSDLEDSSSSEGSSQRPNRKRKSKEQEKRARKRRRDRESDRRAHELVSNKLLRAFMAEQLETKKAAALKTSHLKDPTEKKAKLFRVLSAKDYNEKPNPG